MGELTCDFAMISETWFRGGKKLTGELSDIEQAAGVRIICKNRPIREGRGGGVALAFNVERCNLKRKQINSKFELVGATGKIGKIERQFAIFCVYVPPKTKTAEFVELCEVLASALIQAKTSSKDPIIVVGGDFNNRDPTPAFDAIGGLDRIPSGPTRGTATLDHIFTNALPHLAGGRAEIHPPLESEEGLVSDHKSVWGALAFSRQKDFEWVRVSVRLRSDKRVDDFKEALTAQNWNDLDHLGAEEAVEKFEKTLAEITDRHFPIKSFRRRSNEKPWITNGIRKKSRKKKRIFRRRGRTESWRELTRVIDNEMQESREAFVDQAIEKGGNGKHFYSVVRKLSGPGATSTWSVRDLFPGATDQTICNRVTEYFSSVGGLLGGEPGGGRGSLP